MGSTYNTPDLSTTKNFDQIPPTQIGDNTAFNIKNFIDNSKILVKFRNTSNNPDPVYSHDGDSGFDLRAVINENELILNPLGRKLIPTGLHFELPESYEMQIRSRSGLAVKNGIGVLTGTIDQNYRGEVHVLLINLSEEPFTIKNGDRIAQGVLVPRLSTEFGKLLKVEQLSETTRNNNGFGSTGVK